MNMRPSIDIHQAAKMWVDGMSSGVIAAEFGVSRNAIMGLVNRNRDLFPEKKTNGSGTIRKEYSPSAANRVNVDMDKLQDLWAKGIPLSAIASRFGVSPTSIRGIVWSDRERFPRRDNAGKRGKAWQEAEMAEAERMWRDGSSATKIAEHFGVAKAAVLGIAYRHRDRFPMRNVGAKRGPRKPMPSIIPGRVVSEPDFGPKEPQIPATEYDLQRMPWAKTLVDLEPCECKWPLTAGGPFMFCAETTEKRGPYCTNHLERSLPRPEHRRLKAAA